MYERKREIKNDSKIFRPEPLGKSLFLSMLSLKYVRYPSGEVSSWMSDPVVQGKRRMVIFRRKDVMDPGSRWDYP